MREIPLKTAPHLSSRVASQLGKRHPFSKSSTRTDILKEPFFARLYYTILRFSRVLCGIPMTDQATWIFLSYHAKRADRKVFSATVSIAIRKGSLGEVSFVLCKRTMGRVRVVCF